jgi:hypothetical protein
VIEVEKLLGDLRSGWAEMLSKQGVLQTAEPVRGAA